MEKGDHVCFCFYSEELEPLLAPLKEEWAAAQGRGGGARTPFEYFCNQVRGENVGGGGGGQAGFCRFFRVWGKWM